MLPLSVLNLALFFGGRVCTCLLMMGPRILTFVYLLGQRCCINACNTLNLSDMDLVKSGSVFLCDGVRLSTNSKFF